MDKVEVLKNQLSVVEQINPLDVYNTGNIDSILDKIFTEARSHKADISSKKGREDIASLAYKVSRSKTFLDDLGKKLGEDAKKTLDAINSERKKVRDALDGLKDEVRKPLTDWEDAEKDRISGHEAAIDAIRKQGAEAELMWQELGLEKLESYRDQINEQSRSWEEFEARASEEKAVAILKIEKAISTFTKWKQDQEELERLRAEEAARKQKEHEERIAKEASEKARKEAEEKAAREKQEAQDRADEERRKVESAKAEAERKTREAELMAKAEKERAERAIRDAKEAEVRAERAKAEAVKREAERIERLRKDQEAKEKADLERREANKRHTAKINNEAMKGLLSSLNIDEILAKEIVIAIAQGRIPNVKINY